MATDYDAPRTNPDEEPANESLETTRARGQGTIQVPEIDDADTAEGIDLPGADLSGEELTIQVIPEGEDEFVCDSCFLVRHRSQLARTEGGHQYCSDCES
ncbi:DUF4193 domain-containing protein [Kocuria aegyptia]|uniref:DUF4193 domain-containing protein n=1 Tax=Kocuria aegyptia TaxID=330943 RepID=A0ABN2KIU1_9MICC